MANNYISYGMKGDNVKALQEQLNTYGGAGLQTDGVFGPLTKSALEKFQSSNGIASDGIYGNETMGVFNTLASAQQPSTAPATSSDGTSVQTTPTADANGIQPFNYDYSTDPLYQKQAGITQSQIAQQMAARGVLNSTIDQERTAAALGALGLDFKNQAYNQYAADRTYQTQQQRQLKEDAWTTAQERGYFNNDEARLWGLTPGTKTASAKAKEAAAAQAQADKATAAENAKIAAGEKNHSSYVSAVVSSFPSNFNLQGKDAVISLLTDPTLTDADIEYIIAHTGAQDGQEKTAKQILDELMGLSTSTSTAKRSKVSSVIDTGANAIK